MDKKSMDVVLVMDSSGSMKKTDPHSLRIPAAKLFLSLLNANDRACIVSFSDAASALSPLILLNNDDNRNKLLESAEKITSTGLHTNLYAALNKGLEIFSADGNSGKEKIIILMSDGMMDTGDAGKDSELSGKLKNELTKSLVSGGIKVYAIAFTEASDRLLLEKVSKATGGFYNLALTDKDFHVVFTSVFESLKTPDMLPISDNSFLVDTSIEELIVVASKSSADITIQLQAPGGQKYSSKNKMQEIEWFVSNNFEMMTVKKPLQGKWGILFSAGKNNKAYVITDLNLMTNFNELYPLFGQTLDIKVWLEREGKTIKERDILEKITVYLELTKPDGKTVRLDPFDKGEGILERKIELYTAGNYMLRIIADGKTFQREKNFSFKASDVKESQEDIKMRQEAAKEEPLPQEKPVKEDNEKHDGFSWVKVAVQFIVINLIIGSIALVYFKKDFLKNFVQSKLKRKKSND